MMKIYLIPNLSKSAARKTAVHVMEELAQLGAEIFMDESVRDELKAEHAIWMDERKALSECDVIVTIGGDGTILHAARKAMEAGKPIMGINRGRMGFLATAESGEHEKLERLVSGDWKVDERTTLAVRTSGRSFFEVFPLNDVVLSKKGVGQTVDVRIYCDGTLVNEYRGDGVVVATPTGSTAYSLSAGGPVLDARISGLVVTPICAHSMHSPPMVFSAQRKLLIRVVSSQEGAVLCCDGTEGPTVYSDETVEVTLGQRTISLVSFDEAEQFRAIDKKLKGR